VSDRETRTRDAIRETARDLRRIKGGTVTQADAERRVREIVRRRERREGDR